MIDSKAPLGAEWTSNQFRSYKELVVLTDLRSIKIPPLTGCTFDRARYNSVIAQLRLFIAARNQNLRAGMIERNQGAAVPVAHFRGVVAQSELMTLNRLQCLK